MEKKHSVVAGLLFVLVFLTMFSRNYLGVHTPQDVLVGFISTAVIQQLFLVINLAQKILVMQKHLVIEF